MVTVCPARANCCPAARPAGPEPTTATFLPDLETGVCGMTQPSSQARSMMVLSIDLIETGGSMIPKVQADSQGAGHNLPVNSGKLFVFDKFSQASFQRPRKTKSLNSGMRLSTGHPVSP